MPSGATGRLPADDERLARYSAAPSPITDLELTGNGEAESTWLARARVAAHWMAKGEAEPVDEDDVDGTGKEAEELVLRW